MLIFYFCLFIRYEKFIRDCFQLKHECNEFYFANINLDYDESEYDVDESSIYAFASRKKGTLVLPELDSHSSLQQSDVDLELTSQKEYSSDEDPWTLSANGPATVMSNRIPIAPYDNYGKKKCGPTETEGDLKMFLPKRHSIEGPMIDNMLV